MDLLALLHSGKLSLEEAERIFDDWNQRFHSGEVTSPWDEQFELSRYEATAHLHGATLGDLVKLRYEGWPTACSLCGEPLDYTQYGWFFVHDDADGHPGLHHLLCPNPIYTLQGWLEVRAE